MMLQPQDFAQLLKLNIWDYFKKANDDPGYRDTLAIHYLTSENHVLNNIEKAAFGIWIRQIDSELGIKEQYISGQPYASAAEMHADFCQTGILKISTDYNEPVVLNKEDNLRYRKIHDAHHLILKADFSWQGELKACAYFCSLTDNPLFHRILFSELILQVAACFYRGGSFPDEQKLVLTLPV